MFSDESRNAYADGRTRVYRRTYERHADCCVLESDRFCGGSLMVSEVITGGQKMDLVVMRDNLNVLRYINDVLRPHAIPFLHNQDPGVTFQHDNGRSDSALITRQFLAQNNVDILPWPAVSPDLSPVEQVWD